ncbi:FMN phosphatase YigB (HAD superfamily) [Allocatelliglobosispora scoriae]|uniref:FMN phosphatase YigB (HAD superfamily) n=1 Tax=Allocatelliglobosispora scoriae TaxID=643052 RepID=A0A841BQX0_9ACTN|nr:HAD family hydrolase [Allocatelliglobosispora scoriae]MBB5869210.1 FMN phosphatase YigB (HAD superfamily) [Allocatelliglobosispora scoriae]
MLPTPRALLLDFGGTIVTSYRVTPFEPGFVERVHDLIGGVLSVDELKSELNRADAERGAWRDSTDEQIELTHEQLWGDYVAKGWPDAAREAVLANARDLTYAWARRSNWKLRPGILDLLEFTVGRGLPVAVVSNTRCGAAHRDFLDDRGLTGALGVQIYSDELGYFKPHPEMVFAAARDLRVEPADCWFVGDLVHTDIAAGRRAGVGAAILMPDGEISSVELDPRPDAIVADGTELLELLRTEI